MGRGLISCLLLRVILPEFEVILLFISLVSQIQFVKLCKEHAVNTET